MKNIYLLFIVLILSASLKAQDISGSWVGKITVGATKIRLVFNIKKLNDTSYTSTFDSPDQKAFGIPCKATVIKGDSLLIDIASIGGNYKGLWNKTDSIAGLFKQGAAKLTLNMLRKKADDKEETPKAIIRPQTPMPPFNYFTEDVEYDNADKSLHYGATFTRPNAIGKYPTAIIISGSGTQDRNGTIFNHQPYWVLADYLAKNGIAVLRVDDRGAGKSSLGTDINNKTSLDFSYDVEASLNYLETRVDVDKKHLGLIGHSEGGIIAPMVAARRKDVDFIVMWAGPEVGGAQTIASQMGVTLKNQGVDSTSTLAFKDLHFRVLSLFASSETKEALDKQIAPLFNAWKSRQSTTTLAALNMRDDALANALKMYNGLYDIGWFRFFISYKPEIDLAKVKCKVLTINGSKDTQVDAKSNLKKIGEVLAESGNKHFVIKEIPGLNHLLQTAGTGDISEYEQIEETISPFALKIISDWVKLETR
jgi:pimeloyl-ACP methyl ester carboxylesterase